MNSYSNNYHIILIIFELLGSFTNLINILVYLKMEAKNIIQQFHLASSGLNLSYLLILLLGDTFKLYAKTSKFTVTWELYFEEFFSSGIAVSILFVQMRLFIQHYLMISNKRALLIDRHIK